MKSKILWGSTIVLIATLMGCAVTPSSTVVTKGEDYTSTNSKDVNVEPKPTVERSVALVIGNSNYSGSPLRTPVNDAKDVGKTLKGLGFNPVFVYTDLSKTDMQKRIEEFGKQVKEGDTAFFFFSGHGVQIDGKNYLVPVGAELTKISSGSELVFTEDVVDTVARAKKSFIALDACRSKLVPVGTKSLDNSQTVVIKALTPIDESSKGASGNDNDDKVMGVFYAAAHGNVAVELPNDINSLFTKHLVENLKKNLTVRQLIDQVGKDVKEESVSATRYSNKIKQTPHYYGSTEDFCLTSTCAGEPPPPPPPPPPPTPPPVLPPPPPPPI